MVPVEVEVILSLGVGAQGVPPRSSAQQHTQSAHTWKRINIFPQILIFSFNTKVFRHLLAITHVYLFLCTLWKAQQCDEYVRLAWWSLVKSCRGGSSFRWKADSAISLWSPPRMQSGRELRAVWEMSLHINKYKQVVILISESFQQMSSLFAICNVIAVWPMISYLGFLGNIHLCQQNSSFALNKTQIS